MSSIMKLFFVFSMTQAALQAATAHTDTVYAGANLWRSPLPSTVALTGSPSMGADFAAACAGFKDLVKKYADLMALPDQAASLKPILEQARRQPIGSQFPSATFLGKFKVDFPADGNLLSDSVKSQMALVASAAAALDVRPRFTQAPNACYVSGQSFSAGTPKLAADSLSVAISAIGIAPLPATFVIAPGDGAYVTVSSLDTACDFANGKLTFQIPVPATAQLSIDQQTSLRGFYLAISTIGDSVTAKYHEPIKRAAALGYRLGEVFAKTLPASSPEPSPEPSEDQIDDMIDGALAAYFVDGTLDLNMLWTKSVTGENVLEVHAGSDPVEIQLLVTGSPAPAVNVVAGNHP